MDCEGLEQVDIVVEACLEWLKVVETHSVLSGVAVVGVGVVLSLVCSDRFRFVRVLWVGFHEWVKVAVDGVNATGNLHDGGDEILHIDGSLRDDNGCLHDNDVDLRDDVRSVRVNGNDDRLSHGDDENEESDEEGSDMMESDDDDEIRIVQNCDGSHDGDNQRENGGDESNDQSDDDGNPDHKILGKCF